MLLCFVLLCLLTSCRKTVSVVELESVSVYNDTSYHYKVIDNDSIVDELVSSVKMKNGDKPTICK